MTKPRVQGLHERRSWHYPPPWDGVKWLPTRAGESAAGRARDALLTLTRLVAWSAVAGAVLTLAASAAAALAGGGA